MTFVEHCRSHGIVPGAVLNSVLDENCAVVREVREEDLYAPARVLTSLHRPTGMPYDIVNEDLPFWAPVRP